MNAERRKLWLDRATVFFGVFLPFALGHYMSSLLRNVNAVMAPVLVSSLSLSASQLGLLTSSFFFAVVLAQLPIGIALERYGPYRVQLTLLLLAAVGVFLFAKGQNFIELVFARAVIGFGVGGTLVTAVKAVSARISRDKLPSLHGYLIAVGGLGAASATLPVRQLLRFTDWRGLFVAIAGVLACIALLTWLVKPGQAGPAPAKPACARPANLAALAAVWRNRDFRRTIGLILISHTIFWGVQGLWIGRWLADVARFSDAAVAYLLYLSMAAVIFGAIAVGMITEWAGRRGMVPLDVAAIGIGFFVLVQFAFVVNYAPSFQLLAVLFTLVGTIAGVEYSIVAQSMPKELTSHASSCLNMLIFLGAFLVQAGFGQVIGCWHPDRYGHYPALSYRVAFGALVLLQLPGLVRYLRQRRPVQCKVPVLVAPEEEYEVSTLRSSR
jgi:MFS family permease